MCNQPGRLLEGDLATEAQVSTLGTQTRNIPVQLLNSFMCLCVHCCV